MKLNYCTGTVSLSKILILLIILVIIPICFNIIEKNYSFRLEDNYIQPRGVITTLIRSDTRTILLTINMIHSIVKFHSTKNNTFYPLIIFHDINLTSVMRQYILSCTIKNNTKMNISFALANFQTSSQPANESRLAKTIGYRIMCQFWTYDIFYHPAITEGHYDYLMRMDADSYFSDVTKKDLFVYIHRQKFDYIYRAEYWEPITPMVPVLEHFLYDTSDVSSCIYNNFFIIRLKWFYESKRVQTFIQELIRDDLMIREYIGDGCAHAAMLKIDNQVRVKQITDISYGHNYHIMPRGQGTTFVDVKGFDEEIKKSCQQLTVLRNRKGTLTRISIS
ncbi:unnamed protein product [Adineta steineri]|uniref:Hexosyltransferase n=1 Tax=Adineta steineri TaxID=433720 RepID=A0A818ZFK0_9BILA|nr:unnamed protein product [Adineta steineri]